MSHSQSINKIIFWSTSPNKKENNNYPLLPQSSPQRSNQDAAGAIPHLRRRSLQRVEFLSSCPEGGETWVWPDLQLWVPYLRALYWACLVPSSSEFNLGAVSWSILSNSMCTVHNTETSSLKTRYQPNQVL